MPRHLISDAHEWINEIPTVPIYYLANPQPRERAWQNQRGKKTLEFQVSAGSIGAAFGHVHLAASWRREVIQTGDLGGLPLRDPMPARAERLVDRRRAARGAARSRYRLRGPGRAPLRAVELDSSLTL